MLTIADVLEPQDVARVRGGLATAPFRDGKTSAGAAARKVKSNQQADGANPGVQALAQFVREAMERNPVFKAYVRPTKWAVLFNRYGVSDAYGLHVDDAVMAAAGGTIRTDLSFTLFLSDPGSYEGGELLIEGLDGQRSVKLAAGSLVIYQTGALHRVAPVTSGTRLACVGWVQSLIRRDDEREILFDLSRVRADMEDGEPRLLLDRGITSLIRLWADV